MSDVTTHEMRNGIQIQFFRGKPASRCAIYPHIHHPEPHRFIYHHKQPKVCGGLSDTENLIEGCDNCHYTVHEILWLMSQNLFTPDIVHQYNRYHVLVAKAGYDACVAAGTVNKIPKESSGAGS